MESFIGLFFPSFSQESFENQETWFNYSWFNYSYHSLSYWRWEYCALYIMFSLLLVNLLDNWITYFCLNFPRLYRSDYGLRFLWCGFAILKYLVILVKKKIVFSWFSLGKDHVSSDSSVIWDSTNNWLAL